MSAANNIYLSTSEIFFLSVHFLLSRDFGLNKITEISGSPFESLTKLQDLLLDRNELTYVSADTFLGLANLQIL